MPTAQELLTLVDKSKIHPAIDTDYFPKPDKSFAVWSSEYVYSGYRHFLDFDSGELNTADASDTSYVPYIMCVRGATLPNGSLKASVINEDTILTDPTTGLVWQKTYKSYKTWEEALEYCENMTYAGKNDWRLPNRNELLSLSSFNNDFTAHFPDLFFSDDQQYSYSSFWSSTTHEDLNNDAWTTNFGFTSGKYNLRPLVICVRNDVCDEDEFFNGEECLPNPCDLNSCDTVKEKCEPRTESVYECVCTEGYLKSGSECINPCESDTHSDGFCTVINYDTYTCGCNEGFSWNGGKCQEFSKGTTLGNICTGQNICYDDSNEITCPAHGQDFFGQDAQYAHLCIQQKFQRKILLYDEVILDRNTGLQWQESSSNDYYSDWISAYIYCDQLTYGGFSDWRLPTPQEFLTIVDKKRISPPLTEYFYSENSRFFWTSKKSFKYGFVFSNSDGDIKLLDDDYYNFAVKAKCVRGKELPTASFATSTSGNGDVVVTDSRTGLMWQGTYDTIDTWKEALSYCENLNYAEKSDWRLPNQNELVSLLNYDKTSAPYSDFPDMPASSFWSSTNQGYETNIVRSIDFLSGYCSGTNKDGVNSLDVRCVRYAENNDPCENHTCGEVENSTHKCIPESRTSYSCECSDGYVWNDSMCVIPPECSATSGAPCKDSTSQLTWSSLRMSYADAALYCRNLSEGGVRNWRLPTISELRTLIQNCTATETEGSCGITDNCLSNECRDTTCGGCLSDTSIQYSKLGDDQYSLRSSSTVSDNASEVWFISFYRGYIGKQSKYDSCYIRCVK